MAEPLHLLIDRTDTPIGELIVVADPDGHLRAVDWTEHEPRMHRLLRLHYGTGFTLTPAHDPAGLTDAMATYFAGDLAIIDRLPVRTGGTGFQRTVWEALRGVPCGTTITYTELARRAGRPAAVRAAGHANGANPVGIVVPCHRVVGTDGSLTGYGGGIERKRWLLAHERQSRAAVDAPSGA
ncbi:methylated-DNA-[protein]-cysteine S-methyltransferase [Azospirillum agricola]|uniref:methylated-DNA--[protein]-cysteine S-methyltransferase n=1 Tax=Azospirillum agricola TaxID=1720247 RepID=UPI001AE15901|nr:methylated-DNA--[protein]-cysteine S-methyltransferase [Azospirillum agricola]MBP2230878.1 methylated-DNA-[protein]-cysteine S-methyltransferase [Azospirillum agricola]